MIEHEPGAAPVWSDERQFIEFRPQHHRGRCVIHARALRAFLEHDGPVGLACLDAWHRHRSVFQRAAADKIAVSGLTADTHFHLNSRDLARARATCQSAANRPCQTA